MNREILFRAKDVETGEWRYGYLITLPNMNPEHRPLHIFDDTTQDWYEIDASTVCQYTGLIDENDVKIFEGDIVRTKQYGKDSESGQNFRNYDVFQVQYKEASFWIENSTRRFVLTDGKDIEVIGNIFDNPEMLKGAVQSAAQDGLAPAT